MIGGHRDSLKARSRRPYQAPGCPIVAAAPQIVILRIDHSGKRRVENEETNHSAKVEHTPGAAAVVSDIGASHIAGDKSRRRIVGADQRMKHRASATRTQDLKSAGALSQREARTKQNECQKTEQLP